MRSSLKILSCLAILAIPLSVNPPAYAQQSGQAPANGDWSEDRTERQQFREERENIRSEHEQLEAEHDRLRMQCMDAKGQDRTECKEKGQALHQKQEALHQRMKALHEKMEADHAKHPHAHNNKGEWKKNHDTNNQGPKTPPSNNATPAPTNNQ